jgi:hypothetical protein
MLVLLLSLLAGNYLLFMAYISSQKTHFKKAQSLDSKPVLVQYLFLENELFVNKDGIEWDKSNSEMIVNGVFHEIVGFTKTNKGYVLTLQEDKKENDQHNKFDRLHKDQRRRGLMLFKLLVQLNYLQTNSRNNLSSYSTLHSNYISDFLFSESVYIPKNTEPPENKALYC